MSKTFLILGSLAICWWGSGCSQSADFETFSKKHVSEEYSFENSENLFLGKWSDLKKIAAHPDDFNLIPKNWIPESEISKKKYGSFLQKTKEAFARFDFQKLNTEQQEKYILIENMLERLEDFLWEKTPKELDLYQPDFLWENYFAMDSIPISLEEKLKKMKQLFSEHQTWVNLAKANLTQPDLAKIEQALAQNSRTYFFLKNELTRLLKKSKLSKTEQKSYVHQIENAQLVIKDFLAFLTSLKFEQVVNLAKEEENVSSD